MSKSNEERTMAAVASVEKDAAAKKKDETKAFISSIMTEGKVSRDFSRVQIIREGDHITIPKAMPFDVAIDWIQRQKTMEDKIITFHMGIRAYPLDGAYALYRAIGEVCGFVDLAATEGPSEKTPPHMIGVKLPNGATVQIPWGKMQFPGMEGDNYLETKYNVAKMEFEIHGKFKKMWEGVVARIADETKKILKEDSIYKGHAIKVDLSFIEKGGLPVDPQFMDVSKMKDTDILLNKKTKMDYSTSVLLRIEKTKECVQRGMPLKHGCLLAGPYGTGKTLMANWTAKKAVDNGWTFIYVENCRQIKDALRLAEMYSPAVVFAEDIDKAVEGERSIKMNEILNTFDGIDTKRHPIITILTTNHIENINKAFLRAGRIDSLIFLAPLDEETAMQFINSFCKTADGESLLSEGNYKKAAAAMAGIVPAFGSEIINKAKMYAFYRGGIDEKIIPADLETAALSLKDHIKHANGVKESTPYEKLGQLTIEVDKTKAMIVEQEEDNEHNLVASDVEEDKA
jgi:transitional endoplasmic reticulum ATPase